MFFKDIAGAFDRVDMKKLITKFKHLCGCDAFVDLLASCFAPRSATIAAESKQLSMENIIFQRIVLGPNLWNTFFADVRETSQVT